MRKIGYDSKNNNRQNKKHLSTKRDLRKAREKVRHKMLIKWRFKPETVSIEQIEEIKRLYKAQTLRGHQ